MIDRKVPKGLFSWSPDSLLVEVLWRVLPLSLSFSPFSSRLGCPICTTGSSKVTLSFKFWDVRRLEDGDLRALLGLVATFWAAVLSGLGWVGSPGDWLGGVVPEPGHWASTSGSLLSEVGDGLWPSRDLEALMPKGNLRPDAEVCFFIIRCKLSALSTLSTLPTMGCGRGLSAFLTGVLLGSSEVLESVSDSLRERCISCLSRANFSSLFSAGIFFEFLEEACASWNSKDSFSWVQTLSEISFPSNWRRILSESSSFTLALARLDADRLPRTWIPSWTPGLPLATDSSSTSGGFHWDLLEAGEDGELKDDEEHMRFIFYHWFPSLPQTTYNKSTGQDYE